MYCALYPIPPGVDSSQPLYKQVDDSTPFGELAHKWHYAACHDGFNVLFRTHSEVETNFIRLEDFVDADGEQLTGDQLAWVAAQVMVNPDRPAIYGKLSEWAALFKHPAYRLYCGKYEDESLFRADIDYVSGMIERAGMLDALEQWKAITEDMAYGQSQDIMVGLIRSFDGV